MTRQEIEKLCNRLDWHEYRKFVALVPKVNMKTSDDISEMLAHLNFGWRFEVGILEGLYDITGKLKRRK